MSAVPDDGPPTCADCGEVGVPPRVEYDDLQAAVLCVPCLLKRPDPDVGPTRHDADHTPWPEPMQETAFHGLAGEIVREIEPHSEADPAAILAQFLAGVGNAVGRAPARSGPCPGSGRTSPTPPRVAPATPPTRRRAAGAGARPARAAGRL